MARRPNFGFEKRQKELDRQKKKEAKAERRLARKEEGTPGGEDPSTAPEGGPAQPSGNDLTAGASDQSE